MGCSQMLAQARGNVHLDQLDLVSLIACQLLHALIACLEGIVKVVNDCGTVTGFEQLQHGVTACIMRKHPLISLRSLLAVLIHMRVCDRIWSSHALLSLYAQKLLQSGQILFCRAIVAQYL